MASLARTDLEPSHAIDLLPPSCEVKVKKVKVKKWSYPFLILYFSWNLYILYIMYIPLLLYGRKSAQQLSYGFNILDKSESCPHENQIPYGDMDFSKKVSKVWKVKVIPFWSFIFPETYICYISCIYFYCYRGEKVHNNYLMGLIFSTSWSVPPRKKNSLWGYDFLKKVSKVTDFRW